VDSSALEIPVRELNGRIDDSPVRCTNPAAEAEMIKVIEAAKKEGNTLGGVIEVLAEGVPMGLGSYVQWDRRLEASIGEAFLSMNAFKGVEIGMGFGAAAAPGTEVHDEFFPAPAGSKPHQRYTYKTNRSGGIDGGMSTGQPIVVRAA